MSISQVRLSILKSFYGLMIQVDSICYRLNISKKKDMLTFFSQTIFLPVVQVIFGFVESIESTLTFLLVFEIQIA